MTYLQWLQRYVELAIGDGDSTADTSRARHRRGWTTPGATGSRRCSSAPRPGCTRSDSGPIETLYGVDAEGEALLEDPQRAITALLSRYPDAETIKLHPADVPFFVTLCKTLGKPVNFVPVIDKDVRRWWRSDSLWQAHDARYTADQVCIIPGTEAVVGITRVDEPVGELLDRFEQASIDEVIASGAEPVAVVSRRQARVDVTGPLAVVLDSPDVLWAGRTAINPVHRIGEPGEWQVNENRSRDTSFDGCAPRDSAADGHVTLSVPLSDIWITIRFTLPAATVDGGMPVVTTEDASAAMRAVLAIAAGVDGAEALPPVDRRQHHGHRVLGSGGGRRPHRRHRDVRRAAGARPDAGARCARRQLLARRVLRHRLGRHRRRLPGRRGSAEPGAPRPRGAPARPDAEDAVPN